MKANFQKVQLLQEQKFDLKLTVLQWQTLQYEMVKLATEEPKQGEQAFDNIHKCWQYTLATLVVKVNNKLQKNHKYKAKLSIKISSAEYYAIKEIVQHIENPPLQMYIHSITALI